MEKMGMRASILLWFLLDIASEETEMIVDIETRYTTHSESEEGRTVRMDIYAIGLVPSER